MFDDLLSMSCHFNNFLSIVCDFDILHSIFYLFDILSLDIMPLRYCLSIFCLEQSLYCLVINIPSRLPPNKKHGEGQITSRPNNSVLPYSRHRGKICPSYTIVFFLTHFILGLEELKNRNWCKGIAWWLPENGEKSSPSAWLEGTISPPPCGDTHSAKQSSP